MQMPLRLIRRFLCIVSLLVWGCHSPSLAPGPSTATPVHSASRCNAGMFTPNYSTETGVFDTVRWERFPLKIWIEAASVQDAEEMNELRTGLAEWSKATGGILGVSFVKNEPDADILVRMVDTLTGAN